MSSFICHGLSIALQEPVEAAEVEDEIDGEREASNAWEQLRTEHLSCVDPQELRLQTLEQVVENASRVVTDATDHEYRRLMKAFEVWLKNKGYIEYDRDVFGDVILDNMPECIAAWIMEE
ncbi:uncharacterized protein LAESUDRAFT_761683 [Laetiporus sulphureus 93-53]|uniref:Uncharacterized protein n=1 Tax=Laetiporus sulphureus 93-53 TaxID=1314785 RepID=A0A165CZV2_9APHY|nr:uncharacterized protein LAESUDRAFT_761683 [Laetiporus sulphureus 93-53]KZT03846.1 hypothetical protein LAESUDRAFT_761683 [Laetiporus sulphureus 93-53]